MNNRPGVGVGVYIRKGNKILFGKRKNAHGQGSWCPPGGHLEYGESLEDCAKRETYEETGLDIKIVKVCGFTNDIHKNEKKHYITIQIVADHIEGDPKIMEPDKCEQWAWYDWDNLPKPLFLAVANAKKQNFDPFNV